MNSEPKISETPSRREREKAAHRREILDAAIKVFAQKGYHVATLDEIAQEAEFSKAALYQYFSNKEDMLYNILDELHQRWMGLTQEIFNDADFKSGLTRLFMNLAEAVYHEPNVFTILTAHECTVFRALTEEKREELITSYEEGWKWIEQSIRKEIAEKKLRDLPVLAIMGIIQGALDGIMINKWHCRSLKELKAAIPIFIDVLFNGISQYKETAP